MDEPRGEAKVEGPRTTAEGGLGLEHLNREARPRHRDGGRKTVRAGAHHHHVNAVPCHPTSLSRPLGSGVRHVTQSTYHGRMHRSRLLLLPLVVLALAFGVSWVERDAVRDIPLAGEGQAFEWSVIEGELEGRVAVIPTGTSPTFLPGSRVIAPPSDATAEVILASEEAAARQRDWLASGTVAGADQSTEIAAMGEAAMLDLYLATHTPDGDPRPPQAAPTGAWRFVWPRDAAFVAAALSRTGHTEDAVAVLEFLAQVQPRDGLFEARYRVNGEIPDDRGTQLDGAAWALWSAQVVVDGAPEADRAAVQRRLAGLIETSSTALMAATETRSGLPTASMDYWELPESSLTLGTAAPVLAGLESLSALRAAAGDGAGERAAQDRAAEVRLAVVEEFAPTWTRYANHGGPDSALSFALPPFQDAPLPGAVSAWRLSAPSMARAGGGLAPGADWSELHYSWTPSTALTALSAAHVGDQATAIYWLEWLAAHRTLTGSLPEKVSPTGEPAQVAPLAWTSSLVLLTLVELG